MTKLFSNISTLKEISSHFKIMNEESDFCYLLIHTTSSNWLNDFNEKLASIEDSNQQLVIGLSVYHANENRIDSIFLIGTHSELSGQFIHELSKYIQPKVLDIITILDYLNLKFSVNPNANAVTFLWSTNLAQDTTIISYRAIAPAYQKKGLMTHMSLAFIDRLKNMYGHAHALCSVPTHPAVYRFFRLRDNTNNIIDDNFEICYIDTSCGEILSKHQLSYQLRGTLFSENKVIKLTSNNSERTLSLIDDYNPI